MSLLFETDWLASIPFFFNKKTGKASSKISKVMPQAMDLRIHGEGLYNYIDFGYSVFGQTPVENVQFLPPAAQLLQENHEKLIVKRLADPVHKWWDYRISESDIIELIKERVQNWEAALPSDQEIVLPLSGGYDSRLLLYCLRDKSRVRAYTYGVSDNQSMSKQVVYAKTLARHFNMRWEHIPLGEFHQYFDDWNSEFGISTHAHGMYHFEFYSKIRKILKGEQAFLSGIFGDVWAGSILPLKLNSAEDVIKLGFSHGIQADTKQLRVLVSHELRDHFWLENKDMLRDHRYQMIMTVRLKMILISYLMRVPRLFQFQPWTPYLDIDIVMAMLNLSPERRKNRQWQRDFFSKVGLDLENQSLKYDYKNKLDHHAMRLQPLRPLNVKSLSSLFNEDYVESINRNIAPSGFNILRSQLFDIPKIGALLRRARIVDPVTRANSAYRTLKPIEVLMSKKLNDSSNTDQSNFI